MARKSLVTEIVNAILDDIVNGVLPSEAGLPSEAEIAEAHDVSRLTAREAIRTLQAQGIIRVETGKGSFVNPVSEWESLDAVLRVSAAGTSDAEVAIQLLELRQIFETGAAGLAAVRRSDEDIAQLKANLAEMQQAHLDGDVGTFVRADLAFHDIILKASRNVFLGVMFEPLTRILTQRRAQTSRVHDIQAHAIVEHRGILEALTTGDPDLAKNAMDSHMRQTLEDLQTYVLSAAPAQR
ncbi:FCD domain-containing protein [Lysinibacter cavernae]|uniref:DNA-binding FadR family transcriptional regulator n=1 Tax=Lysinibacter cavernae TaxID=1640652 RepID=A0A7X5TUK7_9MICO|nr:DNA-binding FadR family transcriptional regulator [Lysinibacter cavernae]